MMPQQKLLNLTFGLPLLLGAPAALGEVSLFGVTGDGASTPEELFTLSTADATPTPFLALGAGDDGESIAFDPEDGRLYHASGDATPVFEAIDLDLETLAPIARSGFEYGEAFGMTWDAGAGAFLLTNSELELVRLTPAGVASKLGEMDHTAKGLAFVGATLYSVSPGAATLRVVDPADGSTLTSTSITLTGHSVDGATGLAAHPSTGELWALLKATPVDPPTAIRVLARLEPSTGAATLVGDTGDRFAGIAFGAPEPSPAPALSAAGLLLLAAGVLCVGSRQQRRATRSSSDS